MIKKEDDHCGQNTSRNIRRTEITKQAVYQRMEAIQGFRENHTTMVGNRIIVDESGEKLIINFEENNKYNRQEHHQECKEDKLDILMNQLTIKDAQIKELQVELLNHQQIELAVLNENKALGERIIKLDQKNNENQKHYKIWIFRK